MPLTKAKDLLAKQQVEIGTLLDCLTELSDAKGYLQGVKRFKIRDPDDADSNIEELDRYINLIKEKISAQTTF